jgi:Ni,Fe-hydrogenase III large subunit
LRYAFYGAGADGWVHVLAYVPLAENVFPSVVEWIHAADWHEREAEDLFGVRFEGHPHLGDFVLHDDAWQEGVEPMRRGFDAQAAMRHRLPFANWRPRRIVHESGAFVMPIGPIFSGVTESVHFLLETVGEDVIRSSTRLFYKWRAVEKLAEGKTVEEVLLLAERFAATTAFAHGLAFSQAVESIGGAEVPPRARTLRVFLAELERLRQHAGAIQEICESTALVVATSQAGILEEELLRVSGELTGHRYLFGLLAVGGLLCDLPTEACRKALGRSQGILRRLNELERQLSFSSSFLDRIEEVGVISAATAKTYSLVGPVARASGLAHDLRRSQPYSGYNTFNFDVPTEQEGDGYARLRVLFAEARQSVHIMEQAAADLKDGVVCRPVHLRPGAALRWVEAPRGATFHWVRLDEGARIARYRVITPSFANWHSFHLAAENFAFQDFPIILSTFDLSVAENDR